MKKNLTFAKQAVDLALLIASPGLSRIMARLTSIVRSRDSIFTGKTAHSQSGKGAESGSFDD